MAWADSDLRSSVTTQSGVELSANQSHMMNEFGEDK